MSFAKVYEKIPKSITANESVSWRESFAGFSAVDWTLVFTLVSPNNQITINASADGDKFLIELSATVTAAYQLGEYRYQAHVSKGEERYKVAEGLVDVLPDFSAQADGYDHRSHVKKVLDALEANIEGRASKSQMMQTAEGIQIQHMSLEQMINLRDRYANKYRRELEKKGFLKKRTTIKARFRG